MSDTTGRMGVPSPPGADDEAPPSTERPDNSSSEPSAGGEKPSPTAGGGTDSSSPFGMHPKSAAARPAGPGGDRAKSTGQKAATTAAGGAAAGAAGNAMLMMMIIAWLRAAVAAAIAAAVNALKAFALMLFNFAKAAIMFPAVIGMSIASFTGGAVSAVVGTVITAVVSTTAVAAAGVGVATVTNDPARNDTLVNACTSRVSDAAQAANVTAATTGPNSAQSEAMAKQVYSFLGGAGMKDENIAGILGNWTAESQIDPTSVETIFTEPFRIGPRKQAAEQAGFAISTINPSYAAKYPAIHQAGMGLGQWTNDRNLKLQAYAKGINKPWSEVNTQLGFMLTQDDPTRVKYMQALLKAPAKSVDAATDDFMSKWEGISDPSRARRHQAAAAWFAKMGSWTKDPELSKSILATVPDASAGANQQAVSDAVNNCVQAEASGVSNASLAQAMLSYSYATTAEGKGNDGTPLYQELHRKIFPGDPYFQSCDRGVATAVRWSGTDDTFPPGAVATQIQYLASSPKWTEVKDWGADPNKLLPGDILIRYDGSVSHIVMFVGQDLVKQAFGDKSKPGSMIASASYGTRSPGVGTWYTGGSGLNTYRAFRSAKPEANSKYKNLQVTASTDVKFTGATTTTSTPIDVATAETGGGMYGD